MNRLLSMGVCGGRFCSRPWPGESLSQVRTFPPSSTVPEASKRSWTQLKKDDVAALLTNINKALEGKSKQTATSAENLFSDAVKGNIAMCSDIFEKCGNASNQNVSQAKSFPDTSGEFRHMFASVLQGVGNLHWMGVGLCVLAFCVDRWNKVESNKSDCWDVLDKLRCLADHMLRLINVLPQEKIEHLIDLIGTHVQECLQQINASSRKRIVYAATREKRLQRLDRDISYLFSDLTLSTFCASQMPMGPTTFSPEHDAKVGLAQQVDDIISLLEEGPSANEEVRAIVFCGMRGVGTSTMGEASSARLAKMRFQDRTSCRVLMKQVSRLRELDFPKMQSEIVEKLSSQKRAFADHKDGHKGLSDCFKALQEPVLIFIDNVAYEDHLRCLLPDNMGRDLPKGSRLLVATFKEGVCHFIKSDKGFESCRLHVVNPLGPKEAEELFCRNAFEKSEVPEEFNDPEDPDVRVKMHEVLAICEGLPLALELVGKYVGKPKESPDVKRKEAILRRLGHAVETLQAGDPLGGTRDDFLARTLKFAYVQLAPGSALQSAFLDISANYVGRSWKEAEILFGENLPILKGLSLLKKEKYVHGDGSHWVLAMHPLLVALGQRQNHVDHDGVRVVAKNSTVPDCPHDPAGQRLLELLHLDNCTVNPVEHFEETGKLRHLELHGMEIKKCSRAPAKLQSFHFRCPKSQLPFSLKHMDNLVVLKLSSNPLVDERDRDDLQKFKMPARLKILKLNDSKALEEIHTGRISSLEHFMLYNCPKLQSIGRLSPSLKKLTMRGCPQVKDLSGIGDLHALEKLSLIDCGLTSDNFRLPSNLKSVDLSDNPNLDTLPHFCHTKLKQIALQNCPINLSEIPRFLVPLLTYSEIPSPKSGRSKLRHLHSILTTSRPQSFLSALQLMWDRVRMEVRDHRFPYISIQGNVLVTKFPGRRRKTMIEKVRGGHP